MREVVGVELSPDDLIGQMGKEGKKKGPSRVGCVEACLGKSMDK